MHFTVNHEATSNESNDHHIESHILSPLFIFLLFPHPPKHIVHPKHPDNNNNNNNNMNKQEKMHTK